MTDADDKHRVIHWDEVERVEVVSRELGPNGVLRMKYVLHMKPVEVLTITINVGDGPLNGAA